MGSRKAGKALVLAAGIALVATYVWIASGGGGSPPPGVVPPGPTATATAAAVVATAGGSATASPSAPPSPSASPAIAPLALRSDRAWLTRPGSAQLETAVRTETDATVIQRIDAQSAEVSPDGRMLAYWSPAGVRRVLQLVPTGGGAPVTLLSLGAGEYGNAVAWSTDGTGLAVRVDSMAFTGGIDPPPSYSSVRLVDIASRQVREIARRPNARLTPLAWLRDRALVPTALGGGIGGYTGYAEAREDGTMTAWALPSDFCTSASVIRPDRSGTSILSLHPSRCVDASRPAAPSRVQAWAVGTDPAAGRMLEIRDDTLRDAAFVPGSSDIVVAIHRGDELRLDRWTGTATRTISTLRMPANSGIGFGSIVPRATESVALFLAPQAGPNSPATPAWRAKLIDLATDRSIDVDVGAVAPYASAVLGR